MLTLKRIYGASFVFSLALALSAYVNSSFLAEHVGNDLIGLMYALSACVIILGLEILPHTVKRIGNRNVIMTLLIGNIAALGVLASHMGATAVIIAFIVFSASNTLIWYCLDIFVEHYSENKKVGSIRGLYLSLTNLAWIGAPILAGILITKFGFSTLYLTVLVGVIIVACILKVTLRTYHDVKYRALSTVEAIKLLSHRPDLARITAVNFLLQFFYAWMVIYTPLYLNEIMHIPFEKIGIIFTIMLVPFILIEYPIGRLIDTIHHERQFLIVGILIMAVSTACLGYVSGNVPLLVFAGILFATRVGASMVEVISESYFFKSVTDADAEIISLFRSTYPLAFIIAPLLATAILAYYPYQILYYILAGIILLGIFVLDKITNITT